MWSLPTISVYWAFHGGEEAGISMDVGAQSKTLITTDYNASHLFILFITCHVVLEVACFSSFTSFCVNFCFNWTSIFVTKQDLLPAYRWEWTWLKLEYSLSMTWAHPWRDCNLVGCSLLKGSLSVYVCVGDIYIQHSCIETKNLRGSQSVGIYVSKGVRDFL